MNANYRNKMRRLFLNLKDKSNKRLRESVVDGDLPVARFCTMTPQVRLDQPLCFDPNTRCANLGSTVCSRRKWHLKNASRRTKRWRRLICSSRWAPKSRKQKQMPSSAAGVNRQVARLVHDNLGVLSNQPSPIPAQDQVSTGSNAQC